MQNYKEIFNRIEDALRKKCASLNIDFDKEFSESKNVKNRYKRLSDKEIFWTMVCIIFYSGMNAYIVSTKLPTIKKYLYDYQKVMNYSQKEIDQYFNDPNTIHYKKKVEACVANAKEFYKIVKEFGSFANYLESFGDINKWETICKVRDDLKRRFEFISEITVYHFLMDLGFDVIKPDRVIRRIFLRLGLIKSKKDVDRTVEIGRQIAFITGHPLRYVDLILVRYGQVGDVGICFKKKPKCEECGVRDYCDYSKSESSNVHY
ncbi:MAG: DNA-3-methyladenine glycosylase I [Candidatus Asgardarchaeia archaeon]